MKYLITGATGFLGPYLVNRLISEGHTCRCLVRSTRKSPLPDHPGIELVEGDITRPETLEGIAGDMNTVLHMATLGHMSNFSVTESMFEAVNLHGTINIMREAMRAGVLRVVHCSTVAAMGICDENPANEQSPCRPHHPYGRSKRKAEKEVIRLVREENLPACIVRFSMVYGPGDPRDMLKLARLARKGLFPKIGNKPKLTPLIHAEDAVTGLLLAADKGQPGEIYLLTNAQSEPFDDIRKMLQAAMDSRRWPLYVPEWAALLAAAILEKGFTAMGKVPPVARKNIESTLADRVFSIDKARKELGFEPAVDPRQGLMETVRWYLDNGWI